MTPHDEALLWLRGSLEGKFPSHVRKYDREGLYRVVLATAYGVRDASFLGAVCAVRDAVAHTISMFHDPLAQLTLEVEPVPQVDIPNDADLKVQRYEDLTATEMVGNIAWLRLSNAGQLHEAFRALQVALDLEHFIAVVPLDPKNFTPEDVAEIKELREQTEAITGQFVRLNCLGENTGERGTRRLANQSNLTAAINQAESEASGRG